MIDSEEFENSFISWVSDYRDRLPMDEERDIIPIDGKPIRGSMDTYNDKKAIHMLSALFTKFGLILE
jgi:hypothetical protein